MKLQKSAGTVIILIALVFTTFISKAQKGSMQFTNMQLLNSLNEMSPQVFEYNIITTGKDGTERSCMAIVKKKYNNYLLEFTAPGDLKGTKFLSLDTGQNYIYLPAFGRVRKIVSYTINQGFMGTAIATRDLTLINHIGEYYDAVKLIEFDSLKAEVELQAKPGVNAPYEKINIVIRNRKPVPLSLDCFDASGQKVKTIQYNGYIEEKDILIAGEWVVTDLVNNYKTKMINIGRKINAQLSDDIFSKTNLDK